MSRESFRNAVPAKLELRGLHSAPPQTMGAVRIVPLVRTRFLAAPAGGAPGSSAADGVAMDPATSAANAPGAALRPGASAGPASNASQDLRIAAREYGDSLAVVELGSHAPTEAGLKYPKGTGSPGGSLAYVSFVPHGLIVSYTSDGSPVAAQGASFGPSMETRKGRFVRLMHRMAKPEPREGATSRLRILPLHLAMEGFLALHFNGPDILWSEYSQHALRRGLDPRSERAVRGTWLPGLEEALRTFEILPAQVGVLVFVADALACAFVVPHPDDYRRLHASLLDDFFGELLRDYAILYPQAPPAVAALDGNGVRTLAELGERVARVRADWRAYTDLLAGGLFDRDVRVERVRDMGPFCLERFVPVFDPDLECHLGERIVRADGTLEYLKTFRLSAAQIRRAYLLEQLSAAAWNLEEAAVALRTTVTGLAQRLVTAGFGYLLKPAVLQTLPRPRRR